MSSRCLRCASPLQIQMRDHIWRQKPNFGLKPPSETVWLKAELKRGKSSVESLEILLEKEKGCSAQLNSLLMSRLLHNSEFSGGV